LSRAVVQQRALGSVKDRQAMLKDLNGQIGQLRSELSAVNQQMRQVPRARAGRYSNYFFNSMAAEQYAELAAYRDQLQWEVNQRTTALDQLKSQSVDPKARQEIDETVRDRSEALHRALVDLRRLVDTTREKYEGLAKDPELQTARAALEHTTKTPFKLGPSREFLANVKLLERLEQQEAGGGVDDAASTPARKPRRAPAGKRARKPAASPSPSPATPDNPS
jgi:hypothetical protein